MAWRSAGNFEPRAPFERGVREEETYMFGHVRKTRSDCTVGTYEKKHGLPKGTLRNPDGRKARRDKTLGSLRKQTGEEYR